MSTCLRGGHHLGNAPMSRSCGRCGPVVCADCGGTDDRCCICWVPLAGLPLADLKALMALGGLGVDT